MRIVHVSPFYYPVFGGGQKYLKEVSERLVCRGHDVTVLTRNVSDGFGSCGSMGSPALPEEETINGVKVIRLNPSDLSRRLLRVRGSGLVLRTMRSDYLNMWVEGPHFPQLIAHLLRSKPDVVTGLSWFIPAIPYHIRLAKVLGKFAFVGIPLFHSDRKWARCRVYPSLLAHCDAVLVGTEHEKEFAKSLAPRKSEIHVVGVGVSTAEFTDRRGGLFRARYGLGDRPVVGYVGKRIAQKGVGTLAQAMKIVWRSDERVRLVLAGPLGRSEDERQAGENLLGDLSADEMSRVIQIESFSDGEKSSIFDAFDIFAMPSSESFGIVYLEAWMCRKPVIGARIGAVPYVISEGVDGLLVDPNDASALAAAILDLVRDPEKRKRMGQAGYQKTLARFTWERITDKVEGIYADVSRLGNMKSVATLTRPSITFQQVEKHEQKTTL